MFCNNNALLFGICLKHEDLCSECWLDGCKASHDEEKQRGHLKQWYDNVLNTTEMEMHQQEGMQKEQNLTQACLRMNQLDPRCSEH